MPGVRSATVFGQSMHLLVDESVKRAQIDEQLRKVGISHAEIHESVHRSKTCLSSFRQARCGTTKGRMNHAKRKRRDSSNRRQSSLMCGTPKRALFRRCNASRSVAQP